MIRLTPHADAALGPLTLTAGRPVLVEDTNAGELLALTAAPLHVETVQPAGTGDTGTLFIAPGGIGDALMLEPVIRAAIEAGEAVAVAGFPELYSILAHLPIAAVPYPVPASALAMVARVNCTEQLIQRNPGAHPTDVFAEAFGIPVADKRPMYRVFHEETRWAVDRFPLGERKRVGVQVRATALARTYPETLKVVELLLKRRYEVFLFGREGECVAKDQPELGLVNLCRLPFNIRQSIAVLDTCHAFIAPDSGLLHAAGALGVPTIALYGPFHWTERTRYYPNVRALQGLAPCAPCRHHKRGRIEWPAHGPCNEAGHCVALAGIEPRRVVAKVEELLREA